MLIFPPAPPELELRHRRARAALIGAVVLMAAAVVLWGVSASRLQHTRAALEAELPPAAAVATPLALGQGPGQEHTAAEVIAFLATQARDLGVHWVSVTVAEATDVATTTTGAVQLESWHASIALRGSYRGVKRWMREASGRYPQLLWTAGRWTRAAGLGQPGGKMPAGMAQQPAEGELEVQLQLAWLRSAPSTKSIATSPGSRVP